MAEKKKVTVIKDSVDEKILKKQYGDSIDYNYSDTNQFGEANRTETNKKYQGYLGAPINDAGDLNSYTGVAVDKGKLVGSSSNSGGGNYAGSPSSMKSAMDNQVDAVTKLYNQQAKAQAAKIKQALATQTQLANNTKQDFTNQMNDAIATLNAERAKIPSQTATLNNTASSTGIINAQKIRNSLSQMGLLQSGESPSQQLLNDTTTQNNINANNLQGQELDMSYGNQINSAKTDLASKVKQINDAIALAQTQGDESSLLVLQDAQAKIADATATSAVNYNNFAYTAGRDAVNDRFTEQQFDAQKVQLALDNVYRQQQADLASRQWQSQFDQSNTQFNQNYALQQQQLADDKAYKNASLARSGSSSSRSSSSGLSATAQKAALAKESVSATADAFSRLNELANAGKTRSQILKAYKDNYADYANNNVDMEKLWKLIDQSFQWDG